MRTSDAETLTVSACNAILQAAWLLYNDSMSRVAVVWPHFWMASSPYGCAVSVERALCCPTQTRGTATAWRTWMR